MRPTYAGNAQGLLRMRQAGQKPSGVVVVSMTGDDFDATTLHLWADLPHAGLDWRMLVNLDVWLWTNPTVAIERLLDVGLQIATARPRTLMLRFEAGGRIHDVQLGDGLHLPEVAGVPPIHTFRLSPTNNGGTKVGSQLCRAFESRTRGVRTL